MGDVVVVTGPPGSGKSAVGAALAAQLDPSVLVEADWFFGRWRRGGIAPWLPEAAPQTGPAGRAALAATVEYARSDAWVVYDGVLHPAAARELAALARDAGAVVHRAVLLPPLEVCLARVAARTGHGFDDPAATRAMHAAFAAEGDGPGDETLRTTDETPGALAARVRDLLRGGVLRVPAPDRAPAGGARP
ncbi:AAA family ATPase [Krasilnikoviella flava]|uniref:AAA domain-containing protein n=1 Tax=Krasilnikoviella flava TaxID=526729 RepID=A0A1T5KE07_9MICO|nr:AAA family ATPase [Krasilnikoviella flava]SKC61933.1 AAA domain-containing protein [Krasilnikoviella flava]